MLTLFGALLIKTSRTLSDSEYALFSVLSCQKDTSCAYSTELRKFLSNGCVTLLEVSEKFWVLSRATKRFQIIIHNFEVTSAESRNHAYNTKRARFIMTKVG